jgi:hypothetical protein
LLRRYAENAERKNLKTAFGGGGNYIVCLAVLGAIMIKIHILPSFINNLQSLKNNLATSSL